MQSDTFSIHRTDTATNSISLSTGPKVRNRIQRRIVSWKGKREGFLWLPLPILVRSVVKHTYSITEGKKKEEF
jgi:hypothetical protein